MKKKTNVDQNSWNKANALCGDHVHDVLPQRSLIRTRFSKSDWVVVFGCHHNVHGSEQPLMEQMLALFGINLNVETLINMLHDSQRYFLCLNVLVVICILLFSYHVFIEFWEIKTHLIIIFVLDLSAKREKGWNKRMTIILELMLSRDVIADSLLYLDR